MIWTHIVFFPHVQFFCQSSTVFFPTYKLYRIWQYPKGLLAVAGPVIENISPDTWNTKLFSTAARFVCRLITEWFGRGFTAGKIQLTLTSLISIHLYVGKWNHQDVINCGRLILQSCIFQYYTTRFCHWLQQNSDHPSYMFLNYKNWQLAISTACGEYFAYFVDGSNAPPNPKPHILRFAGLDQLKMLELYSLGSTLDQVGSFSYIVSSTGN